MSPVMDDEPSPDERGDDPKDTSAGVALDLSPRPVDDEDGGSAPTGGPGARRWPWLIVIAALVVAIGFVISRGLSDATQFYVTADEAVARRAELADRSFRLEGSVVEGSTEKTADGVRFKVGSRGVEVPVHHRGEPQALFQACIPIVVEGRWQGDTFQSTLMIVAHDEQYEEENSERLREARAAGAESDACAKRDVEAEHANAGKR